MTRCLLLVVMLCGSACIDWDSLGGTNGGGDGGTGSAKRLFASGFEGDSRIDPVTGAATDASTHLRGTDPNTGYSWETSPFKNNGHGFELLYWFDPQAEVGNVADHLQNTIESVTGFNGTATHALKMLTGTTYQGLDVYSELVIDNLVEPVTDFYARMRVRFDPMVISSLTAGYERFLWETASRDDFVVGTFVDSTGVVHNWNLENGDPAQGGSLLSIPESSVPIPVDRWFVMEVSLHRAADQTGRVVWATDGKILVDLPGPTLGAQRQPLDYISLAQIGGYKVMSSYQWVDDLEIWSAPPCQQMPCGMP